MSVTASGSSHGGGEWSGNHRVSNSSNGFSQTSYNTNSTLSVISELTTLNARTQRQSTVILAVFNIICAAATALGITYHCYLNAKRLPLRKGKRINVFTCVRGRDVFPFILSLGIVGQGIIFAVAQSQGLDALFQPGCALISEFMLPAIYIVPFIQLVFTLETTGRALQRKAFAPRSRWTVSICLVIINIALIITGLVAFFVRAPNVCFASLYWFVVEWAEGSFILLLIIISILLVCATIIFTRLRKCSRVEEEERVDASRMVYYILVGLLPNILMLPFFGYITFSNPFKNGGDTGLTLSEISSIVTNVTGLLNGGLYLFLRSNIISTIAPRDTFSEYDYQDFKGQIMIQGSNGADYDDQTKKPVYATQNPYDLANTGKSGKLIQGNSYNLNPPRSKAVLDQRSIMNPQETTQTPTPQNQVRKPYSISYGLFPSQSHGLAISGIQLQPTTYSPSTEDYNNFSDTLKPPPPISLSPSRHRRDSSMASSATVQIGLRFSNVKDMPPASNIYIPATAKTHALGCPNVAKGATVDRPTPLMTTTPRDSMASSSSQPRALEISPVATSKTLPPLPRSVQAEAEQAMVLNPTVYSPNSPIRNKVPSPKGVGFNSPKRSNREQIQPPEPTVMASRHRGYANGDEHTGDWI
ncbi:hypothetical protein F5Y18DRAFT_418886 [Xylariaceae sp. FL1019]|nr:hypothetical protein F5Y18DRAFT_418886 [Xylariaceae sp. FL1019]